LKIVRIGQGVNVPGSSSNQPRDRVVLADDKGQTLYVSAKDAPGKSNCVADCVAEWPPFVAAADAKPAGEWSLVTREDGSKQWAFRGKPLYTSLKDKPKPGAAMGGGMMGGGGSPAGHGVDGHTVLEVLPAEWTVLPTGITIGEVLTAPGQALTNDKGLTLYTFNGDAKKDSDLLANWKPVAAPQIAIPVGDFTVVSRTDGSFQWAYKGKPLYQFKGDLELGDSNGKGVDKRFDVAMIMSYFMPKEVAIMKDQRRGGVLVTATEGQALYARDRASYGGTGGHNARGGARGNPSIGTMIGVTGCDAACEQTWKPLIAPADAKPAGYWSLFTRPDGSKQWGYQGYALYTYAKEKPGQVTGHDTYDLAVNHDTKNLVASNMGLYWRVSTP
jgi:predicted lipoprotein with Yx(FWY)xxD motif